MENKKSELTKEIGNDINENMEEHIYDAVIIGGGPGGYICATEATKLGLNVVLVEKDKLGGVCANTGCIPTKALKASAEVYHTIIDSGPYGIDGKIDAISAHRVFERARKIAQQASDAVKFLLKKSGVKILTGYGKIIDRNTVDVNGHSLKTKNIVIATGTRPRIIPYPNTKAAHERILTSDNVFNIDHMPKTMAILGGGVIGCEFAGIFPMLGVNVTIVEPNVRLLNAFDPDIGDFLGTRFRKAGINVITGLKRVEITENGLLIDEKEYFFDKILLSVGRTYILPDGTESLGLKQKKYNMLEVNEYMQTNIENIYAIGDIAGGLVAHAAYEHGRIAALNIAGIREKFVNIVPHVIYTSPEIAVIGNTNIAPEEKENKYVKRIPYSANSRAMTDGKIDGFAKIAYDKENKLLGATIIGNNAGEIIGYFALAIRLNMTIEQTRKTIFPHPTYSEIVHQVLDTI